MIRPGLMA